MKLSSFFHDYCYASVSECFECYKFWCRDQHEGESIKNYVTALKNLSVTCNFEQQKEKMISNKLVFGVYNKTVKEDCSMSLLLISKKVVEICRAAESSKTKLKEMVSEAQVHMVNKTRNMVVEKKANDCGYCGTKHQRRNCPAYGTRCSTCEKRNHCECLSSWHSEHKNRTVTSKWQRTKGQRVFYGHNRRQWYTKSME